MRQRVEWLEFQKFRRKTNWIMQRGQSDASCSVKMANRSTMAADNCTLFVLAPANQLIIWNRFLWGNASPIEMERFELARQLENDLPASRMNFVVFKLRTWLCGFARWITWAMLHCCKKFALKVYGRYPPHDPDKHLKNSKFSKQIALWTSKLWASSNTSLV